jgi:hypothetical protein
LPVLPRPTLVLVLAIAALLYLIAYDPLPPTRAMRPACALADINVQQYRVQVYSANSGSFRSRSNSTQRALVVREVLWIANRPHSLSPYLPRSPWSPLLGCPLPYTTIIHGAGAEARAESKLSWIVSN